MTPHIEDALVAPPNQSSYLVISLYFSPQALFPLQIHLMIVFSFKLRNLYVNNSHHPSHQNHHTSYHYFHPNQSFSQNINYIIMSLSSLYLILKFFITLVQPL